MALNLLQEEPMDGEHGEAFVLKPPLWREGVRGLDGAGTMMHGKEA